MRTYNYTLFTLVLLLSFQTIYTQSGLDSFPCTNTLYQVISNSLKELDPLTGEYLQVGEAPSNYNGAGFNVQDGYIYGINNSNGIRLWKIGLDGSHEDLGLIEDFSGRTYVGDFDEYGNLYTYSSGSNASLSYIDVDADDIRSVNLSIESVEGYTPAAADITYNPLLKKFLGLSSGHELFVLDQVELTSQILGDFSDVIDVSGSFGAAWSDQEGNSYFANNNTGKIYRFTFSDQATVESVNYVATGQPTNANDGMGCFYSLPPFETNCRNGIDEDGDGLTDCDDPDCAQDGLCPLLDITFQSVDKAGPNGIIPFHITMINNVAVDVSEATIKVTMPSGFSFLGDTLELIGSASFSNEMSPSEDDNEELIWSGINVPVGDTIMLSFSVLSDYTISDGEYVFQTEGSDVLLRPYVIGHSLKIEREIYDNPKSYNCEPAFYQVYKKRGEANIMGKLNPQTGFYNQIAVIDPQANGLGFDTRTGFAYGSNGKKFIRMDSEGNVTYLGLDFERKVYVGDVDNNGQWYGKVGSDIIKVDIDTRSIGSEYPNQGMPGWDMAYNIDGSFYSVHGSNLYRFNPENGQKESLGELIGDEVPSSGHGAQWSGKDGYHYISNNKTGYIYRVDVEEKSAVLSMISESNLQFNDGFACPLELPVVFQYDYSDHNLFPVVRNLVHDQDINNDNIPDFNMVWLGDKVSHEIVDASDSSASGDSYDDGFRVIDEVISGDSINVELELNSNSETIGFWALWIDWDLDGHPDHFESGHSDLDGHKIIPLKVIVPLDFSAESYGVRVRAGEVEMIEEEFYTDLFEPGEVEDYLLSGDGNELCANGIDDNIDGLLDCDDPFCLEKCDYGKSGSSGDGGLESNGDLIDKINKTKFQRKVNKEARYLKIDLQRMKSPIESPSIGLKHLIPVDVIEGTETYINTPTHLLSVTNASELFAVDIFENEDRVAAILALESDGTAYEHTKHICDRLTGSTLLKVLKYKVDGHHDFIIAKLELPNGDIEYACSFGIRFIDTENFVIESFWNVDEYTNGAQFYNFQVWANNTNYLFNLVNEILQNTKLYGHIDEYSIGDLPEVFISKGIIENDELILEVVNNNHSDLLTLSGQIAYSETQPSEYWETTVGLTGLVNEQVRIPLDEPYYASLSVRNDNDESTDYIFVANGAWSYYAEQGNSINSYKVNPTSHQEVGCRPIKRGIQASGEVSSYISFYRSFNPRFSKENFDDFESLSFTGKGNARIEVALMKESVSFWSFQAKTIIDLSDEQRKYCLGKKFFKNEKGESPEWNDVYMLVINVLNLGEGSEDFDLELSDFYFSHYGNDQNYMLSTDKNVIDVSNGEHKANMTDGTYLGEIEVSTDNDPREINVKIENMGQLPMTVSDLSLSDNSNSFKMVEFTPFSLQPDEFNVIKLVYNPSDIPETHNARITMVLETDMDSEEVEFSVSGAALCTQVDHVDSNDLKGNGSNDKFQAIDQLSTNAKIKAGDRLVFNSANSVTLDIGFEVERGGQLNVEIDDKCIFLTSKN